MLCKKERQWKWLTHLKRLFAEIPSFKLYCRYLYLFIFYVVCLYCMALGPLHWTRLMMVVSESMASRAFHAQQMGLKFQWTFLSTHLLSAVFVLILQFACFRLLLSFSRCFKIIHIFLIWHAHAQQTHYHCINCSIMIWWWAMRTSLLFHTVLYFENVHNQHHAMPLSSSFFSRSLQLLFYSIISFQSCHQTADVHRIVHCIFVFFHSFESFLFYLLESLSCVVQTSVCLLAIQSFGFRGITWTNNSHTFTTWLIKKCCFWHS